MPYEEDTVGEIQRPLIFKLKSRFMLKEIVAQRMHVGSCVYPVFDVDYLMGVPKQVRQGNIAGSAAAGTFVAGVGSLVVPTGKRWRLKSVAIWQDSAVALSQCAAALIGLIDNLPLTGPAPAGVTDSPVVAQFNDLIMEAGEALGLVVVVAAAATNYRVFGQVTEEDFRENVV